MGQRKWLLVLLGTACVLWWPAQAIPVAGANAEKPGEKERGPVKSGERSVEFPNTAVIPGDLTEQLGVDRFFSLWIIFLNDDIVTSDKEFTILAPSNNAKMQASEIHAKDPAIVRQLLLDHIVLGKALRAPDLRKPVTVTTLGGRQIRFHPRKDGSVSANGVAVLKSDVEIPQGVILVLEDYLVFDDERNNDSDDPNASPITMITSNDGFPMIELGTHDPDAVHITHDADISNVRSALPTRQLNGNEAKPFYDELIEVLSFLRSGTSDFLRYLEEANITSHFKEDEEYTAFVPMDDSFASWYPIDWGFNPFSVDEFVRETMLNHFVRGKHRQESLINGTVLRTLGGRELVVKPDLTINGIEVFSGDTTVTRGNIQFISDLFFVNYKVVSELNSRHKDKETAPLLPSPWYGSQFLAHSFQMLQTRDGFHHVVDYLNRTYELLGDLPGHDSSWGMLHYTFFVPQDTSFLRLLPQDTADPFIIDSTFRHEMLLGHFVRQRLYAKDLVDGFTFTMANNKTVKVTKSGGETLVNGAKILESDNFVYNLGNIFTIDKLLFVDNQDVEAVLHRHRDEIPSFGSWTGPALQPETEGEATEVVDILSFLNEDFDGPAKSGSAANKEETTTVA